MEYEFLFVVEGIDVDDDRAVGIVFDEFDGLLTRHRDRHLLDVAETGANAIEAAHRLVARLRRALPGMRILRLDPELVGVSDIAERTGRSRQNVLQWVGGERHADRPFPAPEGAVGRSLVWRWAEVNQWLELIGAGDESVAPLREEALLIDLMLPQWQRDLEEGLPLIRMLCAQDEWQDERARVMQMLQHALREPLVMRTVAALPRSERDRLSVVCAVVQDRLSAVLEQIAPDDASALLAVRGDDADLRLLGVASRALPGTVPVSQLGLGSKATVGDLLLELSSRSVEPTTPLALA
ncbi:helix-turn-helix transcriptional regulator [Streptomyces sp. NPDC087317]|uniref:helix-turn-helix transcriptional regulator n=1 Tax=Streptomyces sp. NPDC087317 TaxID=3365784 RepID=UPI00382840E1